MGEVGVGGRFIAVVEGAFVLGVFGASSDLKLEFTPLIHYMLLEHGELLGLFEASDQRSERLGLRRLNSYHGDRNSKCS